MNATGKRRLLKLADFLETATLPGKFDMSTWGEEEKNGRPACGTAACALGWATAIPSFHRAGLRMDSIADPTYRGYTQPSAAAEAFFDMTADEVFAIFMPGDVAALQGRKGRRTVARRIRNLVAEAA